MIAVADTSPLNYLVLIGEADLLPVLFERILIPDAVLHELMHAHAPQRVRAWIANPPPWLEVRPVASAPSAQILDLDRGEREAIQLALEAGAGTVLLDDADGRRQAESMKLEVRGILGVLERGARLGRIDLREAPGRLIQTNFRMSPSVLEVLLHRNHIRM